MPSRGFSAIVCAVAMAAVIPAHGQASDSPSASQRENYRWFNSLGYPHLADKPFVQVTTGQTDPGTSTPQIRYGFLLSDDGRSYSVLFPLRSG